MLKRSKIVSAIQRHPFAVTSCFLFSSYLIWWLSYFPGKLSPDSISHWTEATTFHFSNASPYLYSLIMAGLIRIWETPAMMGLLQIVVLVVTVSTFVSYAYKKKVAGKLLVLLVIFFAIYPVFGIYNVTIWKDVLYSYIVLTALLLSTVLVIDKDVQSKTWLVWLLAVLTALIPLLRFNGVIFFICIPIALVITKTLSWKKVLVFVSIQFGVYLFFSVILLSLLQVSEAPLMKEGIYVKVVGAIYHMDHPNISAEERSYFEAIMPEKTWKRDYQCITVDSLFYQGIPENRQIDISKEIDPNPQFVTNWHKAVITAALKNPQAVIYDKACMGGYLLGVKDILYKYESNIYLADQGGPIKYESKLPLGKIILDKYLSLTTSGTPDGYGVSASLISKILNFLLWSALIPVIVYTFFGYLVIKRKLKGLAAYVVLMTLNIATVVVLVPAASFRYVYVLFVAAPFLPFIYLLENKDSTGKNTINRVK